MSTVFEKRTNVEIHVTGGDKKNDIIDVKQCEEALAEARKNGDQAAEGICLLKLGTAWFFKGELITALKHQEQALAVFRKIGDRPNEARLLNQIGIIYEAMGQDEMSILHREQALTIMRESGDRPGAGNTLIDISRAYFHLQKYKRALELDEKALVIFHELEDRAREATVLSDIARDHFYLQQIEQGNKYQDQALAILPEISHNDGVCYSVLLNAAYFHFGQRHFDRAIEYYQRALAIARKTGNKNNEAEVLKSLALAYFESGHGEKAIELMDAAVQIYDNLGSPLAKKAREQLDYLHKRVSKKWWQFWV